METQLELKWKIQFVPNATPSIACRVGFATNILFDVVLRKAKDGQSPSPKLAVQTSARPLVPTAAKKSSPVTSPASPAIPMSPYGGTVAPPPPKPSSRSGGLDNNAMTTAAPCVLVKAAPKPKPAPTTHERVQRLMAPASPVASKKPAVARDLTPEFGKAKGTPSCPPSPVFPKSSTPPLVHFTPDGELAKDMDA